MGAKEPSSEATTAVIDFARKTGDYQSLSSVDIQVLALVYELEREGCGGDTTHLRKDPKRMVGVGKFESLTEDSKKEVVEGTEEVDGSEHEDDSAETESNNTTEVTTTVQANEKTSKSNNGPPKSWAALVNPNEASDLPSTDRDFEKATSVSSTEIKISSKSQDQFDDAEHEAAEKTAVSEESTATNEVRSTEEELQLEFPSLSAAVTVPYDGSDFEDEDDVDDEERKNRSLQPVSRSGKLYRKDPIVKTLSKALKKQKKVAPVKEPETKKSIENEPELIELDHQSRIIGGMNLE